MRLDKVRRFLLCASLLLMLGSLRPSQAQGGDPLLILISFDGFRWDYIDKVPAPALRRLIARGVRAEGLIPSFPSKTFPNHYTLVTGLHPGSHGIVANSVHDPATERRLTMANRREVGDAMWWGGEPIWVAAERRGRRTAPLFWPGSEAPIGGLRPTYWQAYNESKSGAARVDEVLTWLGGPEERRPSMVTLYFEDVDTAGHRDGPEAPATRRAVQTVDGYLARLVAGLERLGLSARANIVVVSDHGMAETNAERVVVLDDYVDASDVDIVDLNPTLGLIPKPGKEDSVYRALRGAHPRLSVFRRGDTPEHWHYRHPRVPPIVGVVDEGWQLLRRPTLTNILSGRAIGGRGQHGYDASRARSMHGLFVAAGPAFRQGLTVPAVENVHVYPMLMRVAGLPPAPHDGDDRLSRRVLRSLD